MTWRDLSLEGRRARFCSVLRGRISSASNRNVAAPPFSPPRREPSVSSLSVSSIAHPLSSMEASPPWKQNRRFHLLLKIKVTNATRLLPFHLS
ncbi:hypothetical protein DY000_02038558 [Brassica cretica]|nr:hypothetical protein DY000_02038558 [Brassica cretica]